MKDSEAKRMLSRAGFTVVRSTNTHDVYEFDDEIQVAVSRRNVENPHTTRAVEQAIRRAEDRKLLHENRQMEQRAGVKMEKNPPWMKQPFRATFKDLDSAKKLATAKPPRGVDVLPVEKKPEPIPPPPVPVAPEPEETEEDKERFDGKTWTIEQRLPIWRKIVLMRDIEGIGFPEISARLKKDPICIQSGRSFSSTYCNLSYHSFHKWAELMKIPRTELDAAIAGKGGGSPSTIPALASALPDYMKSLFLDDKMPAAKKIAVLRALHSDIPASIELLMEDQALSPNQKLQILAICLQPKEA